MTKHSKILLITERRLIGRSLAESERTPAPLKTGTTNATFQDNGNTELAKHKLKSLARTGESSREHIFKTITGIPPGPVALEASLRVELEAKLPAKRFALSRG